MKKSIILVTLLLIVGTLDLQGKGKDINKTLKSAVIDHIDYDNAPMNLVINDLKKRLKKMGHGEKDLNIIMSLSKGKKASSYKVTIQLDNIPLGHALRYITQSAGMAYFIKDNTIIIADKGAARGKMEVRAFRVRPSSGFLKEASGKKKKIGKDNDDMDNDIDFSNQK